MFAKGVGSKARSSFWRGLLYFSSACFIIYPLRQREPITTRPFVILSAFDHNFYAILTPIFLKREAPNSTPTDTIEFTGTGFVY